MGAGPEGIGNDRFGPAVYAPCIRSGIRLERNIPKNADTTAAGSHSPLTSLHTSGLESTQDVVDPVMSIHIDSKDRLEVKVLIAQDLELAMLTGRSRMVASFVGTTFGTCCVLGPPVPLWRALKGW